MDEVRLYLSIPPSLPLSVSRSRCVRWALDLCALIRAEGQQRRRSEWQCGRTAQMLFGEVQLLPPFIAFSVRLAAESQSPAHAF